MNFKPGDKVLVLSHNGYAIKGDPPYLGRVSSNTHADRTRVRLDILGYTLGFDPITVVPENIYKSKLFKLLNEEL